MSFILPAGKKKFDWSFSGKEEKLQKTAQTEVEEQESVGDPLFDAAKGVVDSISDECPEASEEIVEEVEEEAQEEKQEQEEESAEAVEEKTEIEQAKKATEAIEEAQGAMDEAKEAVEKIEDIHPEEITEDVAEEKDEVEIEIPGVVDEAEEIEVDVEEEGIEKESAEEKKEEEDVEKEGCMSLADSLKKFIHLGKTSPQNKKDLRNYWEKMVGFPPEYVDAMLKD